MLFREIHWLLLNTVTTFIETFIVPVHLRLYVCVIGVYLQRLEPWVTAVCTSPSSWKRFPAIGSQFRAAVERDILRKLTREFWNCEAPVLQTACRTLSTSSGGTRDGRLLRSSSCTLVRPSVNWLHHRLSWREIISVHPFSPIVVSFSREVSRTYKWPDFPSVHLPWQSHDKPIRGPACRYLK